MLIVFVLIYSSKKKLIILDYLYENKFNKLSKLISSILLRIEKFYGSKNQKQQSAWFRLQVRPGQARSGSRLLFHFLAWPGPSIKFLTWPAGQARLEKSRLLAALVLMLEDREFCAEFIDMFFFK